MDYTCQHCGANLSRGDIYEHFLQQTGDPKEALQTANMYGWSKEDPKHFLRVIIVQPNHKPQYELCPDCNEKWPLRKK